jgi:hypothetical protein
MHLMRRLTNGWLVLGLLAATLAMLMVFEAGNRSVYPHGDGVSGMPTIVELHLSFSESSFRDVWDLWSGKPCASDLTVSSRCHLIGDVETFPNGVGTWKSNTLRLDYLFTLIYAAFFVGALGWLWRLGDRWLWWVGFAGGVTVVADWLENSLHLWVLRDVETFADLETAELSGGAIWLASAFASLKWSLLAVALVGVLVGFGSRVVGLARRSADRSD